jgi:CATRA-Associated Small Protein
MSEETAIEAQAWAEACEDALAGLHFALQWELPERRWDEVVSIINDMARALAAHDTDLLVQARSSLELCGPLRVDTRAGGDSREPAPVKTREVAVETIKTLSSAKDSKLR